MWNPLASISLDYDDTLMAAAGFTGRRVFDDITLATPGNTFWRWANPPLGGKECSVSAAAAVCEN